MQDATVLDVKACPGEVDDALAGLDRLVSPEGGLIERVTRISADEDQIAVFAAAMGELEHVRSNIRSTGGRMTGVELSGGGGSTNPRLARSIAIAEALERFSSCAVPADLTWATAQELGDRAVDLDSLPVCSPNELAHPACPAVAVDKRSPMRWTTAWSLTEHRPVWVPAVSVWLHIPAITPAERFTMPISTGSATHSDLDRALLNGICEVIERDAIALTWLQRLPLPRINFDVLPDPLARSLADARARGIRTTFFDATSELGVPTLYSVDEAAADPKVRHVVMCATDLDPVAAAVKMVRETASSRIALADAAPPPDSVDAFHSVFHGATYMGAPERSSAYDFLLRADNGTRDFSTLGSPGTGNPRSDLQLVLDRLAAAGMQVLAVETTTAEAASVGFRVVRVIIPQLMPLAFTHRARYLGHRRLFSGPVAMGYPAHPESGINPLPQPFA